MEVRKEDIENLLKVYGIEYDSEIVLIIQSLCGGFDLEKTDNLGRKIKLAKLPFFLIEKNTDKSNRKLELAKMLYFLRGVKDEINAKGIVSEPRKGEIKNTDRKEVLSICSIRKDAERWLSQTLRKEFGLEIYMETRYKDKPEAGNEVYTKIEEGYFWGEEYINMEVSDNELEIIIKHENKNEEEKKIFTTNRKIGMLCWELKNLLKKHKLVNVNTIKGYSLIYDLVALAGYTEKIDTIMPYRGTKAKEKHTWVKGKIASFLVGMGKVMDREFWAVEIIG